MFAGLPGIGVGTLFYVLIALCMPVVELVKVVQGTSSLARWRRILVQWLYAMSIVVSIALAERIMLILLGQAGPDSMSLTRLLHRELSNHAPQSIFAAPIMASLLVLAAILIAAEAMWLYRIYRTKRQAQEANAEPVFNGALDSSSQ
jgi:ABC-type spermidine/putrescine transport system permease subunit I